MTTFNLRTIRLGVGEQYQAVPEVELEPLALGGESYVPAPSRPEAALTITRVNTGLLFELRLDVELTGPCMRCLEDASLPIGLDVRECQAASPEDSEELTTPYVSKEQLDLSGWARDAIALELPEQILCKPDCAGLCPACGADLNVGECSCGPPEPDSRFAKLAELDLSHLSDEI